MGTVAAKGFKPSQLLLFAPGLLLVGLGINTARNHLSREIIKTQDSPDGDHEAVVYLLSPPFYPFSGSVEAFIDLKRHAEAEPVATRKLGDHRSASEARDAYREIEWTSPRRITLRAARGPKTLSLNFESDLSPTSVRDGGASERGRLP